MSRGSPVARFVLRRAVRLAAVLAGLLIASFSLIHLVPGDPARLILGPRADPAAITETRRALGLDDPLVTQFRTYVANIATGDLGRSFLTRQSVTTIIGERIGPTARVAGGAVVVVLASSVPAGILAARAGQRGRRSTEGLFSATTGFLGAMPALLTATLLAAIFGVQLGWFPVAGAGSLSADVLPILAVSLAPAALMARLVRVEAATVLQQDYVRTATSKRLAERVVLRRHVLPNVLTPALTVGGIMFASLLGGTVIVEVVFARPGLGSTLVTAVQSKDFLLVQGLTLFLGLVVVLVNAAVDLLLVLVDPRTLAGRQ